MLLDVNAIKLLLVIGTICLSSFYGFSNPAFFNKYCFNINAIKNKQYYRLLTSGFLHGDLMHLLFNMLTVYFFAELAIYSFGFMFFLILLFGGVILGNILTFILYYNATSYTAIGASGGVNSIIFSVIALYPTEIKIGLIFLPIMVQGYIFGVLYLCYSIYMEYNKSDNIGHVAHIGGAIFGVIIAFVLYSSSVFANIHYLAVMSLPLLYMLYDLINNKR